MPDLDAATVLREGDWDSRFTRVVLIAEAGDLAIALLDADSDFNLDDFERDVLGKWRAGSASGSADEDGMIGVSGKVAYAYGPAQPGAVVTVAYRGTSGRHRWRRLVGLRRAVRGWRRRASRSLVPERRTVTA